MCRYDGALLGSFLVVSLVVGCEESSDGGRTAGIGEGDGGAQRDGAATRGDAATSPPSPAEDGATGPAACTPALARCDAAGSHCCSGTECIERNGEKRCVETCETRFDCGSLCCEQGLCVDTDLCPPIPCSDVGGQCNGPGYSCCAGLACVSSTNPDYGGCRKRCTAASECDTGCCVPFADGTLGFCAAGAACQCATEGGACGGSKHCCEGLECASAGTPGAFECKPACTRDEDCAPGCCFPIEGTGRSACMPANVCPK